MKHSAYPKYKPSGVEWLGDVPENWEVKRLKNAFNIFNGSTPESSKEEYWDGDIVWITPEDLGNNSNKTISDSRRKITEPGYADIGATIVPRFSIIISTRAPIGHIAVTEVPSCTNQGCRSLVPKRNISSDFYYYYLLTSKDNLNSIGKGTTFIELGNQGLGSYSIPIPPFPEQQAIATFLDRETERIDSLIGKKKKFVELLKEKRTALISRAVTKGLNPKVKMKHSGVEWLGDVPEHWQIKKIKHMTKVISKGTTPSTEGFEIIEEGEIRFIKAENLVENNLSYTPEFFIDNKTNSALSRSILEENDVLIVIAGATIGKVAVLEKSFLPANTNQAVCFIRLKERNLSKLVWYYMQSNIMKQMIAITSVQSAQPNISMGLLKELVYPLPSRPEQQAIIEFLDQETGKIDDLIVKVETAIEKLKEYRTALISAAVTGKIDVSTGLNTSRREVA